MKLPRDLSGRDLASALTKFGYQVTRQRGSHLRLTTETGGQHHVTIPDHGPLRVGLLSALLTDVAEHLRLSREQLADELFG